MFTPPRFRASMADLADRNCKVFTELHMHSHAKQLASSLLPPLTVMGVFRETLSCRVKTESLVSVAFINIPLSTHHVTAESAAHWRALSFMSIDRLRESLSVMVTSG